MTNPSTISNLPPASTPYSGSEYVPLVQNGITVRGTIGSIVTVVGVNSVAAGNGISTSTTSGVATVSLSVPVSIANGGTGATTLAGLLQSSNNLSDVASAGTSLSNLGVISITPQGRLTFSSTLPVITTDYIAQTVIYYLPYVGQIVPVWNGTNFTLQSIGATGVSLTLNTTNMPSTQVFDVYASMQSGVLTLSAMYWGGNTARSTTVAGKTGAGNASIVQKNGLWVNNAAISASDSFNNTTGIAIPQNQGTYLGSFYTTANGQSAMACRPAAGSGGDNNFLGLYNAYNRVRTLAVSRDSTSSWTYTGTTWRAADNSTSNRITFVDGLQESYISADYTVSMTTSSGGVSTQIGVNLDSTSATPGGSTPYTTLGSPAPTTGSDIFYPQLGLHYVQAMELSSGSTATYLGSAFGMALKIALDM